MQNRLDLNLLADGDMLPAFLPPGKCHSDWCRRYCAFYRDSPVRCERVKTPAHRDRNCNESPVLIFVSPGPRPGDNAVAPEWVLAGLSEKPN